MFLQPLCGLAAYSPELFFKLSELTVHGLLRSVVGFQKDAHWVQCHDLDFSFRMGGANKYEVDELIKGSEDEKMLRKAKIATKGSCKEGSQ